MSLAYPWPHCASGKRCTMGDPEDEACRCACRCACKRCRIARWGVTRDGVYRPRWQWWAPWGVTDFWRPRVFKGGDEWCNVPLCFVVPPLGGLAVFPPGPRRTMPCAEEWEHMDDSQRADYAPCGRYHAGRVNWAAHPHLDGPCEEATKWLRANAPGDPRPATMLQPVTFDDGPGDARPARMAPAGESEDDW